MHKTTKRKYGETVAAVVVKQLYKFGQELRSARKVQNMTQQEYAIKMGFGEKGASCMSNIETGKKSVSFATMVAHAMALGLEIEVVLKPMEPTEVPITQNYAPVKRNRNNGQIKFAKSPSANNETSPAAVKVEKKQLTVPVANKNLPPINQ